MCCITNASFSILINGVASEFFHPRRVLRKGCPLSPFLFLLIIDGFTNPISSAREEGNLMAVKITKYIHLNHLLFFDYVLIFLDGSIQDSNCFNRILTIFCKARGMMPNLRKSTIMMARCSIQESRHALLQFHFGHRDIGDGIKYLGFRLKPNDYRITE